MCFDICGRTGSLWALLKGLKVRALAVQHGGDVVDYGERAVEAKLPMN